MHLAFSRSVKTVGDGIRTHRFTYPMERWTRHGLAVTSPAMTFIHLAVRLDLVDLVSFGDRLVARDVISPEELVQAALAWEGHGRRASITAARLVRARSESVPETHSRLLMVLAGLPEPACNHPYLVDGVERFRLDLAWVVAKVALIRADDLYADPDEVVRRVSEALRERGCNVTVNRGYQRWFQPRGAIA